MGNLGQCNYFELPISIPSQVMGQVSIVFFPFPWQDTSILLAVYWIRIGDQLFELRRHLHGYGVYTLGLSSGSFARFCGLWRRVWEGESLEKSGREESWPKPDDMTDPDLSHLYIVADYPRATQNYVYCMLLSSSLVLNF